jgi:hypothetical protein
MTLIAALTGAFGLLSSFVMLRQGLDSMAMRYPLAVVLAYAMFLFLIWLWLRTNRDDYTDVPDLSPSSGSESGSVSGSDGGGESIAPIRSGGGGDFGGGGASARFDTSGGSSVSGDLDLGSDLGDAAGSIADADELAIPLLAIGLAVGLAFASLYVIYIAPALLAEVLVDGALSYALYRYVRGDDPGHWLASAVRRTFVPFIATAIFLGLAGAGMSAYAPGSRSVGEVVRGGSSSP